MPDAPRTALDRQRLTDLFRRHGDAVFAYASDRLGGEDAQDLVAEVFVVAWRRLATIKEGQERPWLFGVARQLVMQHRRNRASQAALQIRLYSHAEPSDPSHSSPAATQRAEVLAALTTLREADRDLLLQRYWYNLSGSESAMVLESTVPTLVVRLHRARRRFTNIYEDRSVEPKPSPAESLTAHARGLQ